MGKRATLIVGECWSGKTTMAVSLLEDLGGEFVADGRALISYVDAHLKGHYIPRNVYLRFLALEKSEKLSGVLEDVSLADATQIFDKKTIDRIIGKRAFNVDAGLQFSRKKFTELLGVTSTSSAEIDRVVFARFSNGRPLRLVRVNGEDTWRRLRRRELVRDAGFGLIGNRTKVSEKRGIIQRSWLSKLEAHEVSFSRSEDITRTVLEDLI